MSQISPLMFFHQEWSFLAEHIEDTTKDKKLKNLKCFYQKKMELLEIT